MPATSGAEPCSRCSCCSCCHCTVFPVFECRPYDLLQSQASHALAAAVESFERPVFPCALIAGDVVILHLLNQLGFLSSGKVQVVFIDTFHLFPETHTFLKQLEVRACLR